MHSQIRSQRREPRALLMLLALTLITPVLGFTPAAVSPREPPGNPAFQRVWERTDQPVISGETARTWMWGPQANTGVLQ